MTEAEWNACTDPQPMVEILGCDSRWRTEQVRLHAIPGGLFVEEACDRKLRLFACACCWRIWSFMTDQRSCNAVQRTEQFVDGLIGTAEFIAAAAAAAAANMDAWDYRSLDSPCYLAAEAARLASNHRTQSIWRSLITGCAAAKNGNSVDAMAREHATQASLLRCIFGPLPFRPVAPDPSWLTATVTSLAAAIYDDRSFDRLPILADALEDAGCTDADILNHCRQPGEHCRGCWVVDLLLGKE
jgi:hypothetical protein